MPQLTVFAVCEKCLLTGEGTASLIVLMQQVTVTLQPNAPKIAIPANAVYPTDWCAYSLWVPSPDERGVDFSAVFEILWPDKTEFKKQAVNFRFKETGNHNVLMNINGFPVGQIGKVIVNMWLERDSQRVVDVHSWTIEVEHKPSE